MIDLFLSPQIAQIFTDFWANLCNLWQKKLLANPPTPDP